MLKNNPLNPLIGIKIISINITRKCKLSEVYCKQKCLRLVFNSLPNDKFLDRTKLKAFADDKFNVAKMTISVCGRLENIVGKEENAGYQHFLLFPHCFPKPSSLGLLKVGIVW